MLSLDTETTGLDLYHGARPFLVTTCNDQGEVRYWEWDVDPYTREVRTPADDLDELKEFVEMQGYDGDYGLVLQNSKFDVHALASIGIRHWNWSWTCDTLIAGHLLASNQKHDLASMALHYLGIDISKYEDALEIAVKDARRYCQTHLAGSKVMMDLFSGSSTASKGWAIAEDGRPDMPSYVVGSNSKNKDPKWKYDSWLPRALIVHGILDEKDHPGWLTVCADYANADSESTLLLWQGLLGRYQGMEAELKERDLWEIYKTRMQMLPVACQMESRGVTILGHELEELRRKYLHQSYELGRECVRIAGQYEYQLELPKGASPNGSLRRFCFDHLKLPPREYSAKTDEPSLKSEVLEGYLGELDPASDQYKFVDTLIRKRGKDTKLTYLAGYQRYWVHAGGMLYVLHPNLNPTGTDTLRWSSSNPNEQNIGKEDDEDGLSLRDCFGPAPGREWWSMDYENLELRIPAFEAGEKDLIWVFEHPDDPPYYGSYHLVVADLLYPELFKEYGKRFKDVFGSTYYQWIKNGNFSIIYGAQERKADLTYHVKGAYQKVRYRFPKISALADRTVEFARKNGYVETIPDRSIGSKRGYPIMCTRNERYEVSPTVPFNYHIQSTAMWCTGKAMIRCQERLDQWKRSKFDAHIVLQVHDEMVFDTPARGMKNMPKMLELKRLMEMSGDDIGVPLKVSISHHPRTWGEKERM